MLQKVCWLELVNWPRHWSCFYSAPVKAKFEVVWELLLYINIVTY
jgi:hypothetical protein